MALRMEIEEKPELREVPRPVKLTAERLRLVTELQLGLAACSEQAGALAEAEANGWKPGSPQTERSHRVDDLEALADELAQSVERLERLYS